MTLKLSTLNFQFSIFLCILLYLPSLVSGQTLGAQVHSFKQVYDSVYGIQFYDKYNPMLGGDSVRKYSEGHLCNGLIEDHYPDGTLLHKGFYTDGRLTQFTNYYPNGEVERVFKPTSDRKSELKKYYQNKIIKSDVKYYEGVTTLWQDYFDNGQLSYLEEYGKWHTRVLRRCSYYRDGKPASIFEPLEIKGALIKYSQKEYFPNGQLQEESEALYNKDDYDFLKDGDDKIYDDKGNLINEYEYVGGKINSTIK